MVGSPFHVAATTRGGGAQLPPAFEEGWWRAGRWAGARRWIRGPRNIGGGTAPGSSTAPDRAQPTSPSSTGALAVRQGDGLQTRGRELEDQETDRREHGRRLPARPPAAPPIAPPRYVRRAAGRSSGRSRSHVDDAQHGVRPGPALPTRGGLARSGVLVYASLRARGRCRAVAAAERPRDA